MRRHDRDGQCGGSRQRIGLRLPVILLLLGLTLSCSGSGTDLAGGGIGGSGYTGEGPITALGSIFVNGIEFTTTDATVTLNGTAGNEKELQVGMVVRVEGTVNSDGATGIAQTVAFDHNVEGPISTIDVGKNQFEIMGQTVLVDAQTVLAGFPGAVPDLSMLAANDLVEISGLTNADGNIRATRITRKSMISQSEVCGKVKELTATQFKINTLTVAYSNATLLNFGSLGIQPEDSVIVRGALTSSTTMRAEVVDKRTPDFRNSGKTQIEGFVEALYYRAATISGFSINTQFGLQKVELGVGAQLVGGQTDQIASGARVRVEGTMNNHVIQASRLIFL